MEVTLPCRVIFVWVRPDADAGDHTGGVPDGRTIIAPHVLNIR